MRYAVTGATGWLGGAALAVLRARGAEVTGFASSARDGLLALDELPGLPHDVLLHYAFVTREFAAARGLDAYVAANLQISATVLEAVERRRPAMFYASSGAVHHGRGLAENPYGVAKRIDEHAFRDATERRCSIARIYNVAGPHVVKAGGFALTDLTRQSLRGGPELVVHAPRRVVRSFVDVEDLAAFAIATAGEDLLTETAGAEEIEVGELARRIDPALPVKRPSLSPAAEEDRYVGDAAGFAAACARAGVTLRGLDEQLARTRAALAGLRWPVRNLPGAETLRTRCPRG